MGRVAVTGGSGKLGRAVVGELVEHGYDVVNLDLAAPADQRCPFVRIDLTDYGQVVGALTAVDDRYTGVDGVVHLAAIPAPGLTTNAATFHNNIRCTYNVFEAARLAGIKNVVWASSETVLGLPFDTPPPYIPLDEDYPGRPESGYALCKHLEEQMAAQFCRWDPELKMIGLRFSNVMEPVEYARFPSFDADPRSRSWNLWGYIDARDGAQAVRRALEFQGTGMDVFIIANADSVMSRSSVDLAAEVYPGVPVKRSLDAHETLLSIDKAKRVLGYQPRFTWRDHIAVAPEDSA
ncbi:MAG TPA: NAD(P)-dependent oxidoreductase [Pilimelia sp.]|nr:NAD(P)-dependent oxidoreductase [Pilimelia sp.]